jgi:hypothetical protein
MALHTQRWGLDTCGCIVLETWDDTEEAAARVHTFQEMEAICAFHAAEQGEAVYTTIRAENRRKNLVAVLAKSVRPTFRDADYTWAFDAQRRLVVTIVGLTNAQRTQLQAAADLQFGPGVVVVQ